MVRCVHIVLKARKVVLVTGLRNICNIHIFSFLIGKLLNLLKRFGVVSLGEEVDQFTSDLVNKVCTVSSGSILIHLQYHVRRCKIDAVGNRQCLVILLLLNDTLIFRYAGEARGLLRSARWLGCLCSFLRLCILCSGVRFSLLSWLLCFFALFLLW